MANYLPPSEGMRLSQLFDNEPRRDSATYAPASVEEMPLRELVREYLDELDCPAPDYGRRHTLRKLMREAVGLG